MRLNQNKYKLVEVDISKGITKKVYLDYDFVEIFYIKDADVRCWSHRIGQCFHPTFSILSFF